MSARQVIADEENEDLAARVHGESAIVTGRNVARGKREGKPFITRLRFTRLWIKDGSHLWMEEQSISNMKPANRQWNPYTV